MSEATYSTTVNRDEVYDLMAQHAKVTMEANSIAFERLFQDESDLSVEDRLEQVQRELDLVTKTNSLAFEIADKFMSEEFVSGFQDHLMATLAGQEEA